MRLRGGALADRARSWRPRPAHQGVDRRRPTRSAASARSSRACSAWCTRATAASRSAARRLRADGPDRPARSSSSRIVGVRRLAARPRRRRRARRRRASRSCSAARSATSSTGSLRGEVVDFLDFYLRSPAAASTTGRRSTSPTRRSPSGAVLRDPRRDPRAHEGRSVLPVLIDLGFFQIPTYGVLLVTGIVLAHLPRRPARRPRRAAGRAGRSTSAAWVVLWGLVGAKIAARRHRPLLPDVALRAVGAAARRRCVLRRPDRRRSSRRSCCCAATSSRSSRSPTCWPPRWPSATSSAASAASPPGAATARPAARPVGGGLHQPARARDLGHPARRAAAPDAALRGRLQPRQLRLPRLAVPPPAAAPARCSAPTS